MTNYPRLSSPSFFVLALVAGAVSAMTPACGPEVVSSGPGLLGSGSTQSVGNLTAGSSSLAGTGGTSAVTSTECPTGSERCICYGNNTCNAGLVCASQRCVNIAGLAGGTGGTSGNGGDTNTGVVASGGSQSSTGGASDTGSSNTGGYATTGGSIVTGGAPATGGSSTNGGVAATGGSLPAAGALGTGGDSFWKNVTYSATTLPDPSDGNHNPGQNCIQCHTAGTNSEAPVWLFGGTVYQADGTTPAPHVQVGVNDGTKLYTAYSATNGNFWLGGSGTINWANAQVRIRDVNGESMMAGATPAPTCNLCHNATTYPRITAP